MENNAVITKDLLFQAPIPEITTSYMPVPHKVLVEALGERLDKRNMKIVGERYDSNREHTQMFGVMTIETGGTEMQMSIGFRNSYDKSLAVGLVAGSIVLVCSNLCFGGDIKLLRKHTSGVLNDLHTLVDDVIDYSEAEFEQMKRDAEMFKAIEISKTMMAQLAGKLFIEENLVNTVQMSIIKDEINFSEHFKDNTVWSFYNHVTESLKKTHPQLVMQRHVAVHNYLKKEFYLV